MPLSRKATGPKPGSLLAWRILAPVVAAFIALVILSGFLARAYFEPPALQRDLARTQRYADFAVVVFAGRFPATNARTLPEEFRAAGLETPGFLPPEHAPVWNSPRYMPSGPFVEAWAPVKSRRGELLGAVSLRRQDDATDPKEVWGSTHSEEEQERLTCGLQRLIDAGGTSGQDKLVVRWPDGSKHDILSTYIIVRDESGRATRVLGVNRDVTAELEEERELRSTKERLVAALEGGNFGSFEHIFGAGAANWNAPNYEMHGIDSSITDPDELYRAWRSAVGDSCPAMERAVATLPVDKTFASYDHEATPPGTAEIRRIRSSVFVERNEQGHPVRLVGVARRLA